MIQIGLYTIFTCYYLVFICLLNVFFFVLFVFLWLSRQLDNLNQQQNSCSAFAADLEYFCLFRIFFGEKSFKV